METHPPQPIGRAYEILVPKVDADGNDIAGIRLPAIEVPIGTYTGWNLRPLGLAEGELSGLLGSFIPFAKTKAQREKTGDPRLSIEERYKDRADYVEQISHAARVLVEAALLARRRRRAHDRRGEEDVEYRDRSRKHNSEVYMILVLFVLLVLFPSSSFAEITKIVIEKREPFANGHDFGITGAYEKLTGKAYGEVDPKAKHNKNIVNLAKAPKNERGRVEYSMDVFILKPARHGARQSDDLLRCRQPRQSRRCALTMGPSAATIRQPSPTPATVS